MGEVELCVIAPTEHLEELCSDCMVHLTLPHVAELDDRYAYWYQCQARLGKLVITDNSQHEKLDLDLARIMHTAGRMGATEVAFPDVIDDNEQTFKRVRDSLQMLERTATTPLVNNPPTWMMIPQGSNYGEWVQCFESITELYRIFAKHSEVFRKDPVIGFPTLFGEVFDREDLHRTFRDYLEPSGCRVHLLGWNDDPWAFIPDLITRYPCIRSIDTSKPIVYAMTSTVPGDKYPGRPPDYFNQKLKPYQVNNAHFFIDEFRGVIDNAVHNR